MQGGSGRVSGAIFTTDGRVLHRQIDGGREGCLWMALYYYVWWRESRGWVDRVMEGEGRGGQQAKQSSEGDVHAVLASLTNCRLSVCRPVYLRAFLLSLSTGWCDAMWCVLLHTYIHTYMSMS